MIELPWEQSPVQGDSGYAERCHGRRDTLWPLGNSKDLEGHRICVPRTGLRHES